MTQAKDVQFGAYLYSTCLGSLFFLIVNGFFQNCLRILTCMSIRYLDMNLAISLAQPSQQMSLPTWSATRYFLIYLQSLKCSLTNSRKQKDLKFRLKFDYLRTGMCRRRFLVQFFYSWRCILFVSSLEFSNLEQFVFICLFLVFYIGDSCIFEFSFWPHMMY